MASEIQSLLLNVRDIQSVPDGALAYLANLSVNDIYEVFTCEYEYLKFSHVMALSRALRVDFNDVKKAWQKDESHRLDALWSKELQNMIGE